MGDPARDLPRRFPVRTVDCADCSMRDTDVCDDCVVTFVVNRCPGEALVIDVAEERAVRMLARAGLVPGLRHSAGVTDKTGTTGT